ncbi:MAG: cyclic nucleotide-binding domain-containing protein [Myxococcales bacterium]|jgi:CRP-like cAMP-binding protein|nr:cyclic nucleotide-binding domain-containing protein [Deltaproteobacteria bacterium]NOQ83961.1 cyclic nucleotide-binding domain-containing protein [Myxococcales bacterium]
MSRPPTPKLTADHLADIGLFGGLSQATLDVLASSLPTSRVEAGDLVVSEGDQSTQMFVVIAGELEVFKKGESGGDVRVAVLGPSDWFGEMSIIDVQPRSASVRAVAPTLVLAVTADHVENLLYRRDMKDYALFIMNIARELSRRLRVADGILAQFYTALSHQYGPGQRR